ncbi:hypothetical protein HanPSC8_Chr07g0289631 [Helianthus annuus]|nr:hypothetical protein HanPSC8_Chr07g0289631 [Helianthus annuus]
MDISYNILLGVGIMNPHFRIFWHTCIDTQIGKIKINNQLHTRNVGRGGCIPFSSVYILRMRCITRGTLNRSSWSRRSFSCIMIFIIFRRIIIISSIFINLILNHIVDRRRSLGVNNNRSNQRRDSSVVTFQQHSSRC